MMARIVTTYGESVAVKEDYDTVVEMLRTEMSFEITLSETDGIKATINSKNVFAVQERDAV